MIVAYKRLRSRYVKLSIAFIKLCATPESLLIHLFLLGVWLSLGPSFDWSASWNFMGNQVMTIESDFVGLLILAAMIRSGDVVDAKLDTIQRDLPQVSDELIGLHNRPEEDIPTIEAKP